MSSGASSLAARVIRLIRELLDLFGSLFGLEEARRYVNRRIPGTTRADALRIAQTARDAGDAARGYNSAFPSAPPLADVPILPILGQGQWVYEVQFRPIFADGTYGPSIPVTVHSTRVLDPDELLRAAWKEFHRIFPEDTPESGVGRVTELEQYYVGVYRGPGT